MRAGKEVMSLFRELSYTTCSHSQFSAFCEEEHVSARERQSFRLGARRTTTVSLRSLFRFLSLVR